MTEVSFWVPGPPQGKGRPRAAVIAGKPRLYTPPDTAAYERLIAIQAKRAMEGRQIFDEAMRVDIGINHAIPASWSRKKKQEAMADIIRPTVKPDIDNVIKVIFDAMNGIVWRDDVLVSDLSVSRMYAWTEIGIKVIVRPIGAEGWSNLKN